MSHKGGSGFGNGLIVGMIFGAILVLLFTTKKGRKILRLLSEEGFEKVKDWEHILDEIELDGSSVSRRSTIEGSGQAASSLGLDDDEEGEDYGVYKEKNTHHSVNGSNGYSHHAIHRVKPASRRFFRGIPKR